MALVSYGVDSDEYSSSDNEDHDHDKPSEDTIILLPKASKVPASAAKIEDDEAPLMPRHEWEKELAPKPTKTRGKVQISLPQLPDPGDDSDDDDTYSTPAAPAAKSGPVKLLSMLPAPTTSSKPTKGGLMLPNTLSRKTVAKPPPKKRPSVDPPPSKKPKPQEVQEEDEEGDFFGFDRSSKDQQQEIPAALLETDMDYGPSRPVMAGPEVEADEIHPSHMYNMASVVELPYNEPCSSSSHAAPTLPPKGYISDDRAREMIRKFELESSGMEGDLGHTEFVDVSVDSRLGNVQENILKNLSTQGDIMETVKKREELEQSKPADLAKRKHQITYLAYMAKQREETLKDQWSANKFTRRQTQQKYGF